MTRCPFQHFAVEKESQSVASLAGGDGKTMFADALWLVQDAPDAEAAATPQVSILFSAIDNSVRA